MESERTQLTHDLRHARLVSNRRKWKCAARRIRRVRSLRAVHVIERLGPVVVGREGFVVHRPGRRDAIEMLELIEVLATEAVEDAAPEACVSADDVVRIRTKAV